MIMMVMMTRLLLIHDGNGADGDADDQGFSLKGKVCRHDIPPEK